MHDDRSSDGKLSQWAEAANDRDLLARFLRQSDQCVFAEIVRRHSALVLGVCRRVLRDRHAAEDAFQATFLVLARSAGSIRRQRSLASWLHRVAYRVSMRALAERHRRKEQAVPMETVPDELSDVGKLYEQQLLDEELQDLPEKYREPLILHHLQGLSRQQVAERLGMSVATVDGRLKRGKKQLKLRLLRRGVEFGAVLAAVGLCQSALKAASINPLIALTAQAAAAANAGTAIPSTASSQAASLAGKELTIMSASTKLVTTLGVSAVLVTLIGLAAGNAAPATESVSRGNTPRLSTVFGGPAGGGTTLAQATSDEPATDADSTAQQNEETGDPANASSSDDLQAQIESLKRQVAALQAQIAAGTEPSAATTPSEESGSGDETTPLTESRRQSEDYRTSSPSVERIEEALNSTTNLEFPGNPFHDVVDYLSQIHNIPILLDEAALSDQDVPPETEVRLVVSGITLRDAFEIMLENIGGVPLDYVIEDEVLKLTTRDKADRTLETRVYNLTELASVCSAEDAARIVRATVRPWTWRDESAVAQTGVTAGAGEEGHIDLQVDERFQASVEALADTLVVTQSQRIHREIDDLLEQLRHHDPESTISDAMSADANKWVEEALNETTSLEFRSNPLRDVADYISAIHNIPILLDEQCLNDAGIRPDHDTLSLVISGIKLRSALQILLDDVGGVPLDYIVQHGMLRITTREETDSTLATRLYDVRDLSAALSSVEVALTVRSTIRPWTWRAPAGAFQTGFSMHEGAVGDSGLQIDQRFQASIDTLPDALIITQSQSIHREIVELLNQLRHYHAEPTSSTDAAANQVKSSIEERLDDPTYLNYRRVRLQDVLDRIRRKHNIGVNINDQTLHAAGVSRNETVSIFVSGVTLRSALETLLSDVGGVELSWFIDEEMIQVTTPAGARTSIRGVIRVRGDVPDLPPLVVAGDPQVKDSAILDDDIPDDSLIVGEESGLKNVFVWLRTVPQSVAIPEAPTGRLPVYSSRLQYFPHVWTVRTGRAIRLLNMDPVVVNIHSHPNRNESINFALEANDQEGAQIRFDRREDLPIRITDDIHPTRRSYVLPLDHPFADLTDPLGRFNIRQLPAGEYELNIWHERAGFLEQSLPVTVPAEGPVELDLEVDVEQLLNNEPRQ